VPFYKSIIRGLSRSNWKFIAATVFAHPETSEWFSIISGVIFEVNVVTERKQAQLVKIFL